MPALSQIVNQRFGQMLAWLAVVCVLLAPVTATARMLAMATALDDTSICHADPAAGAAGHPIGDQDHMTECGGLCVLCAPMLAVLGTAPQPPHPIVVARAVASPLPPARAPPEAPRTDFYPRGPPASI